MPQRVLVPGDVVWIRQRRWLVERSRLHGDVTHVDVLSDRGRASFLSPFDRIVASQRRTRLRDVSAANAVRRLAALVSSTTSARAPASALDADMRLWAFQLEPAIAMIEGVRRILIADEVGLGKTIQAGLAIGEVCRRRPTARVLVVVPASLGPQWADELARRFAIPAAGVDADELNRLSREGGRGDNVWRRQGVWICSIDFLKQPHVRAALPREPWDLVVFDEAHALCGDSQRYDAARALASRARALLLLTATPHDGDRERFDRLLELGALPRDTGELVAFRRTRAALGLARTRRVRWIPVRPTVAEREVLDALRQYERAAMRASRPASVGDVPDAVVLLLSVFRKRALSSMHALDISLRRRLTWIDCTTGDPGPEWRQIDLFDTQSDAMSRDDAHALMGSTGLDVGRERLWLCRLIRLTGVATAGESKMTALTTLLRRTTEPVVVFTEFRHTLDALQRELGGVRRLRSLHGGQTFAEQQHALRQFIDGDATLLVATDVASQGLNLQTRARWVIFFDLPWNPARLEQRAGRVDRLGQTRTVHATLMPRRHLAEADVLARIAKRVLNADAATQDAAFGDWHVTEDFVRRAVVAGHPIPIHGPATSPGALLPVTPAWSRAARATARHLERQRRFRAHGPRRLDAASCAFVARLDRLPGISRLCVGDLGIYAVPLLDGTGDVVERRLVAVGFGAARVDRTWLRVHHHALSQLAAAAASARQRRLGRWLRRRAERFAATERALQDAREAAQPLSQFGLFDRRDATNASKRLEEMLELDRLADARVDECLSSSLVEVGAPVLELLLVKPS